MSSKWLKVKRFGLVDHCVWVFYWVTCERGRISILSHNKLLPLSLCSESLLPLCLPNTKTKSLEAHNARLSVNGENFALWEKWHKFFFHPGIVAPAGHYRSLILLKLAQGPGSAEAQKFLPAVCDCTVLWSKWAQNGRDYGSKIMHHKKAPCTAFVTVFSNCICLAVPS